MDITYTGEFDAKRYGRLIGRALSFAMSHHWFLAWCIFLMGVLHLLSAWIAGWRSDGTWTYCFGMIFCLYPLLLKWKLRTWVRSYMETLMRQTGGAAAWQCHITDDFYETAYGEMRQKLTWKSMGPLYRFLDDDTVALMTKRGAPMLVLADLREHGIDRYEFEAVLRKAGMQTPGKSKRLKVIVLGVCCILAMFPAFWSSVTDYRSRLREQDAEIRLFDLIRGADNPLRPGQDDSLRGKFVRAVTGRDEPLEICYMFQQNVTNEVWAGLALRYDGETCGATCGAICPCGCVWRSSEKDWIAHVAENPGIFLPKEQWLEKVRPLAKELYEEYDDWISVTEPQQQTKPKGKTK